MDNPFRGMDYEDFTNLAKMVWEAEDQSEEECDAEARFFDAVEGTIPEPWLDYLDSYNLKATTEERIKEALSILRLHFHVASK